MTIEPGVCPQCEKLRCGYCHSALQFLAPTESLDLASCSESEYMWSPLIRRIKSALIFNSRPNQKVYGVLTLLISAYTAIFSLNEVL